VYTSITNGELGIRNVGGANLVKLIIELCVRSKLEQCHFDPDKWFGLIQQLILYTENHNPTVYSYDDFASLNSETLWRQYFQIATIESHDRSHLIYRLTVKLDNAPHIPDIFTPETYSRYCETQDAYFRYWVRFQGLKKGELEILCEFRPFFNLFKLAVANPTYLDGLRDIPWKSKLPSFEKFITKHHDLYLKHLNCKTLKLDLEKFSLIRKAVKRYGCVFYQILEQHDVNLSAPEGFVRDYYLYNNQILSEPLTTLPTLSGGWKLVQLVTTLDFFEESEYQNNCLSKAQGSLYRQGVRTGELYIFSFRLDGKRQTVCYQRMAGTWFVGESKGKNNQTNYNDVDRKTLEFNVELVKIFLNKFNKTIEEDF
jgi:hypothetical protein